MASLRKHLLKHRGTVERALDLEPGRQLQGSLVSAPGQVPSFLWASAVQTLDSGPKALILSEHPSSLGPA